MNEPRTIEERYATASTTSHLIVDSEHRECDVLVAAGMTGQKHRLALALWGFAHMPSPSRMRALHAEIECSVNKRIDSKGPKGNASKVSDDVLAWWVKPACPACDGLKWEKYSNAPVLSEVPCSACGGTGKRQLKSELAKWMAAELEALASKATDHIKAKLY